MQTTANKTTKPAGGFKWVSLLISLGIAALGVGISVWFIKTSPRAQRRAPSMKSPVVEIAPLTPTNEYVVLEAMGTVVPAREVAIQAEISARIEWVNPRLAPGAVVRQGEDLVRLEARSFEAAKARQAAALKAAESALRLEEGQQAVAKAEWSHMQKLAPEIEADPTLALREPQFAAAQAAVDSARAALDDARYNLERTLITAPFDGVVLSEDVEVGAQARPGAVLVQMAGTDAYWVRAALPVRQLTWIRFATDETSGDGSPVTVTLPDGRTRPGQVRSLLPDLDADARMARVLVEVPDPLGLKDAPGGSRARLLLNDYVRLAIEGQALNGLFNVPRSALRDGNELWMLDAQQKLHILPIDVLWGNRERVFVRGTDEWDPRLQLITSDLATPVQGMSLRVADAPGAEAGQTADGNDSQNAEGTSVP